MFEVLFSALREVKAEFLMTSLQVVGWTLRRGRPNVFVFKVYRLCGHYFMKCFINGILIISGGLTLNFDNLTDIIVLRSVPTTQSFISCWNYGYFYLCGLGPSWRRSKLCCYQNKQFAGWWGNKAIILTDYGFPAVLPFLINTRSILNKPYDEVLGAAQL